MDDRLGPWFWRLIEAFIDPNGEIMDVWRVAMLVPGVISGILFAGLLLVVESGRTFDKVAIERMVVWGAVSGLAIGAIAMVKGIELTLTTGKVFALTTVLGIVAAVSSTVFFRLISQLFSPSAPG